VAEIPNAPIIEFALLCDDVRREITGKDIIIGVYGEELTTPTFPAVLVFNLFMRARFPQPNTRYLVEFRVIGPSEQPLTQSAKSILISPPADGPPTSTVSLGGIPLQIQSPGLVRFQWKPSSDGEWTTLAKIEIKRGAVTLPPGVHINPMTTA
jgi:hypothetical protein